MSKFIHEYLDGELNDSQKEVLFTELSKNPELRTEFDKQVQLHIIAQNDMNTISAPIESTSMIFRTLGFTIPSNLYLSESSSHSSSIAINSGASRLIKYLKKALPIAMIGMLAILFTTILYYTIGSRIFNFENSSSKINKIPVISSLSGESLSGIKDTPINIKSNRNDYSVYNYQEQLSKSRLLDLLSSNIKDEAINRVSVSLGSLTQSDLMVGDDMVDKGRIPFIEESSAFDLIKQADDNNRKELTLNNNSVNSNSVYYTYDSDKLHYTPLIENPENLKTNTRIDNTHFNFTVLHDFAYNENPENSFQNMNRSVFDEIYLSLMYKFDRRHSIGLQVGKEKFAQEFTKTNIEEFIQTTPPILWIGAAYRYSMPEFGLYNIIEPYSQIVVAYTSIGPMFRPQLGIQLYVYNFSITLGGEYNILIYNVEGNLFTSQKIGLVYGLNYHF